MFFLNNAIVDISEHYLTSDVSDCRGSLAAKHFRCIIKHHDYFYYC